MKKIKLLMLASVLACGLFAQNTESTSKIKGVKKTNKHGIVTLAYNLNDDLPYSGNIKEKIKQYLFEKSKELHKDEKAELKHIKTVITPAGKSVGFIQTYKGIPVIGSVVVVHVNKKDKVKFISNHYKPNTKVATKPFITANEAITISIASFNTIEFNTVLPNKAELCIYIDMLPKLVWKINISPDFGGDWYFLIDAQNQSILVKENIEIYDNGAGNVFEPDPGSYFKDSTLLDNNDANYFTDQSVYQPRTLEGLNSPVGGYYYLQGEYAYSMDFASPSDPVSFNSAALFKYNRNQNGFEETNCYYHLDKTIRYVRSLGFEPQWNNQTTNMNDIVFDARGRTDRNASYAPYSDYIRYGVPSTFIDAGEDQSVIIHELGHALHDALLIGGTIGGGAERNSIGEGIADYFGIDYRRQTSWYRPNARWNWFYPTTSISIESTSKANFQDLWSEYKIYDNMRTWVSSLMDLEYNNALDPSQGYRLGRDVVTTLQLASLSYVTASDNRFVNILAMYQADIDIYNGEHLSDLIEVYHNRLLFDDQLHNSSITSSSTWDGYNMVDGNLTVKSGATLTIEPSSTIVLNGDLTVESGANLIFGDNVAIYSKGQSLVNNGILQISGSMNFMGDYDCTISGSGYIYLNGNINAEPGATLTIQGVSQTTKLLEVNKKIYFDTDFANIIIKNGKIVMNNTYAELYIYSGVDNVTIDNVKVTSSSGSNNGHEGIDIRSNGNVVVKNSIFEYGYYGLYAYRGSTSPIINVDDCNFKYNTYGLRAYNGGVDIDDCTFEYNTSRGLYCSSMDKQSYINNNTIRYQNGSGDYGLYYEGSSTARVSLYSNSIYSNYYGVYINGNLTSSIKCNTISNNTEYGVYAYNTDIYLANAPGISGGGNELYSNKYGVKIYGGYASFYLNDGYNDLRSDTYCITGTLDYMSGGTIIANNNYWRTGGGAPIYMSNYNLTGQGLPIYLIDNSPESYFQACLPLIPMSMSASSAPYDETFDYREVSTSIGDLPLNEAVNQILNTDNELGKVYDINTQYELLSEVLTNKLSNLNLGEEWYVKHTYNMFKSALGKFEKDKDTDKMNAKLMDKMLTVIRKLEKDIAKDEKKLQKLSGKSLSLLIDEANILWYSGNYDEATAHLEKLLTKVADTAVCDIKKLICQINVDKAFIESDNNLEIDDALKACEECDESKKIGTINENGGTGSSNDVAPLTNMTIDDYLLTIVPNPVSQSSEIRVFAPKGAELILYSSTGQVMFKEIIPSEHYTKTVTNTELSDGIYMVVISVDGKAVQSQKMVVVK